MTAEQIDTYLSSFGEQLDALRLALIEDDALRELAAAPLMLSIMTLAYQGAPASALVSGGTSEERRKLIFERYVEQMFQRRNKQTRYLREETMRWLVRLASVLVRSAQTLFFIEHMQTDWLSPGERKLFTMGEGLAWGLITGLIVGTANEFMSLLTAIIFWSEEKQADLLKWMLVDGPLGAVAGLITGILIGMVAGALPIGGRAVPTATHPRSWVAIRSAARVAVIVGLAVGVARGVTVGLLQGPLDGVQAENFVTLYKGCDLSVVTAARLSATFPYVTPIARPLDAETCIAKDEKRYHLADGGYYDNFGIMTVLEFLSALTPQAYKEQFQRHKILLIQIRAERVEGLQPAPASTDGFTYATIGPGLAALQVQTVTQIKRNDLELALFKESWLRDGVTIESVAFELQEQVALSWHLPMKKRRRLPKNFVNPIIRTVSRN